jgi:trigger factor
METQIKLENVSGIQKKFTVTIPAAAVSRSVENKYLEVQKTAKLKGFRPGKVPLPLVKQFYASDVRQRVLQTLIDEGYREALKLHPLRVIGEPRVEGADEPEHLHIHDGEQFKFVAFVEIVPEVEPKDYKGLSLEKPSVEVTAEDIDVVKTRYLDRKAELTAVERAAKNGDFVDFRYEGEVETDGQWVPRESLSGDRVSELGTRELLAEFEAGILGAKAGDTVQFEVPYAADYSDAELAGKKARFSVSVREVKEKRLPQWSEALSKEFGFESDADFEKITRDELTAQKVQSSENALREQLIEKLIEKNTFEVPEALVMQQLRSIVNDYTGELRRYGFNDQMIQSTIISQLEEFKKRAGSQVRGGILLDAIGKKEKVTVSAEEIEVAMKKAAEDSNFPIEKLRERIESNPRDRMNFEYRVREDKTIRLVLDAAKIKEKK